MTTNTNAYQFSHGRKPKGEGSWMIKVTGTDGQRRYTTETYSCSGTVSQAKKEAVRRMKTEIGGVKQILFVEILP